VGQRSSVRRRTTNPVDGCQTRARAWREHPFALNPAGMRREFKARDRKRPRCY
jgi:hypothetical protein